MFTQRIPLGLSVVLYVFASLPSQATGYSCSNCFATASAGEAHTCAIRQDSSLSCWGYDFFGQATPPAFNPEHFDFLQVSSGEYHSCAIFECDPAGGRCPFGNAMCWGNDADGQASVDVFTDFVQISAGGDHTCGLEEDSSLACWGADDHGQISPPFTINIRYVEVSAGGIHTCALIECTQPGCTLTTNVKCWGSNGWGQAGVSGLPGDFVQVSSGTYHTCALRQGGAIECWGRDDDGQSTPPTGTLFTQVAAGGFHTCGLTTSGAIECWGRNVFGQSNAPPFSFVGVSAGTNHSCGVGADGYLFCWGNNVYNQSMVTAGMCGLFESSFELGGDCRWSSSSTPCWSADCDGDGAVNQYVTGHCQEEMPPDPPTCPGGVWVDKTARCTDFDCLEYHPLVFSGQTSWFPAGYNPGGGQNAERFDFNCDGVEEKRYPTRSSHVCCETVDSGCQIGTGPGCDPPGWDTDTVSRAPACGETAGYRVCVMASGVCTEVIKQTTQTCR